MKVQPHSSQPKPKATWQAFSGPSPAAEREFPESGLDEIIDNDFPQYPSPTKDYNHQGKYSSVLRVKIKPTTQQVRVKPFSTALACFHSLFDIHGKTEKFD